MRLIGKITKKVKNWYSAIKSRPSFRVFWKKAFIIFLLLLIIKIWILNCEDIFLIKIKIIRKILGFQEVKVTNLDKLNFSKNLQEFIKKKNFMEKWIG